MIERGKALISSHRSQCACDRGTRPTHEGVDVEVRHSVRPRYELRQHAIGRGAVRGCLPFSSLLLSLSLLISISHVIRWTLSPIHSLSIHLFSSVSLSLSRRRGSRHQDGDGGAVFGGASAHVAGLSHQRRPPGWHRTSSQRGMREREREREKG